MNPYALVEATDPELSDILNSELIRQEDEVESFGAVLLGVAP